MGRHLRSELTMTPKATEFFKEFAQLCKKHKITGYGKGFPISLIDEYRERYNITEIWLDKEGEAIVRLDNGKVDVYSDGKVL